MCSNFFPHAIVQYYLITAVLSKVGQSRYNNLVIPLAGGKVTWTPMASCPVNNLINGHTWVSTYSKSKIWYWKLKSLQQKMELNLEIANPLAMPFPPVVDDAFKVRIVRVRPDGRQYLKWWNGAKWSTRYKKRFNAVSLVGLTSQHLVLIRTLSEILHNCSSWRSAIQTPYLQRIATLEPSGLHTTDLILVP